MSDTGPEGAQIETKEGAGAGVRGLGESAQSALLLSKGHV